jgi:hypothetical protein
MALVSSLASGRHIRQLGLKWALTVLRAEPLLHMATPMVLVLVLKLATWCRVVLPGFMLNQVTTAIFILMWVVEQKIQVLVQARTITAPQALVQATPHHHPVKERFFMDTIAMTQIQSGME